MNPLLAPDITTGLCPGCGLPGTVAEPCSSVRCRAERLFIVPPAYAFEPDEARDPLVGRMIDDALVVALLGAGGFGRVYLARLPDRRSVALKLAGTEVDAAEDAIAHDRLAAEARALSRLRHDNVVRLLRWGTWRDEGARPVPYLLMEYVAGATSLQGLLDDWEAGGAAPTDAVIASVLRQLLAALEAAHVLGIVHRDVKPDNVLLEGGDPARVRLCDFGLAKFLGHGGQRSLIVGTPSHMAPEQLRGEAIGPWTDLYALGVIAMELVAGRGPFEGMSTSEVIAARRDPAFDPLAEAREDGDLPAAWEPFFARALAADPAARFQSAAEMRAALDETLSAQADDVVDEGWPELAPARARSEHITMLAEEPRPSFFERRRGLIWTGAALVTLLAATIAIAATGPRDADETRGEAQAQPAMLTPTDERTSSPSTPPAEEVAPAASTAEADAARALVARARTCEIAPAELDALARACTLEHGCQSVDVEADLSGVAELGPARPVDSVVLVMAPPTFDEEARCGASWRRGRALTAGAWDEVPAGYGGYYRPRVALELRGERRALTRWLTARAGTESELPDLRRTLDEARVTCLAAADLPEGRSPVSVRTWEQRSFYGQGVGYTGESGRTPCRLDLQRVLLITPPEPVHGT